MRKYLPIILIFTLIIGVIGLAIWSSERKSSIKEELAKLDIYSEEELSFLEKEGFLDDIDSENLPDNKEKVISLFKSPNLIEQNLNNSDESFEVLATKLDKNNKSYQLAFKLENKSNGSKEFYLIPISEKDQLQFKEIKGLVNNTNLLSLNKDDARKEPLDKLYNVEQHMQELRSELGQAYQDIETNSYKAEPIKIILPSNSFVIAKSQWDIINESDDLKPVYFLVYGSAAGAKEELIILNVHSHPRQGDNWEVEFTVRGIADLKIIPADQATIDDDEFKGLFCDNEQRFPQILEGDVIYYPNWQCNGIGKVVHYTLTAGNHKLRFEFADQISYAYNAVWQAPTSVSSYSSQDGTNTAANTIDGNTDSYWDEGSGNTDGGTYDWFIIYDMGTTDTMSSIRIYADGNANLSPCKVGSIKVCDDSACSGESDLIGECNLGTTKTWHQCSFAATSGRYIEVRGGIWSGGACQSAVGNKELDDFYEFNVFWGVPNSTPTISSVKDGPDPIEVGQTITFYLDWADADAEEQVKIHICKTDTLSSYACEGGQAWCETVSPSTDDPETCTYTIQSGDTGSNTYYAFVCDDEDACSLYTSGTFTATGASGKSLRFNGGIKFEGGIIIK